MKFLASQQISHFRVMWHKKAICDALKTIFSANHRIGYIVSRMLISLMSVYTTNSRMNQDMY